MTAIESRKRDGRGDPMPRTLPREPFRFESESAVNLRAIGSGRVYNHIASSAVVANV